MEYYRIKNLEKYQKLGKTTRYAVIDFKILNDEKIFHLTDSQRWLFIGMIILGCQTNNNIPANPSLIYQRVCHRGECGGGAGVRGVRVGVECLLENGIIERKIDRKIEDSKNLKNETTPKKEELRKFVKNGFKRF